MSYVDDLEREVRRALNARLAKPRTWPAVFGNGAAVVDVPNRSGWVYVRMPDGATAQAFNGGRAPSIDNLQVVVGYDHLNPTLFRVLDVRQTYQDGTGYPSSIGNHAASHEWMNAEGGYDVVYSDARQLLPLRLSVSGMAVSVYAGYQAIGGGWASAPVGALDLTASIPVSGAQWALITLSSAGALTATLGVDGGSRLALVPALIPALPQGHRPLAAVRLYAGQTAIVETRSQQDIVDLRFAQPPYLPLIPDYIQFDLAPTVAPAEGVLYWDSVNGTLAVGMPGGAVNLQIGQEQLVRVQNDSGGPLVDGDLVYVSGASGTNIKVKKARADAESTSATTLGMVTEAITNSGHGYVTTFGVVHGLNTIGYTAGDMLYLSPTTAGGWAKTKPTAPNHVVSVGVVVRVNATDGEIFVTINNGYELDELHDVAISGSAAGDILVRSSGSSLWVNRQMSGDATLNELGALTIAAGAITPAKLASGSALSLLGVSGSAAATPAWIQAAADGQVMRRSGSSIGFGAVNLASGSAVTGVLPVANGGTGGSALTGITALTGDVTATGPGSVVATITNGAIVLPKLASGSAASVLGVAGKVDATPDWIASTGHGEVLRRSNTVIGWGQIDLSAAVSGVLPVANGGTGGSSMAAAGIVTGSIAPTQIGYGSAGSALTSGSGLTTDGQQLRLPVSGSAAGIVLGGDVALYRSAANTLRTDDYVLPVVVETATSGAYAGIDAEAFANPSGNSSARVWSLNSIAEMIAAGNLTNVSGALVGYRAQARHSGAGTVASAMGAWVSAVINGGGTITTLYNLVAGQPGITSGSAGTAYGLYIEPQQVSGVTNGWGVYQSGSTTKNYLQGTTLIGTTVAPSGGGTPVLAIGRAASAPTGGPADTGLAYVRDLTNSSGSTAGNSAICLQAEGSTYEYELGRHAKFPGGQQVTVVSKSANYTATDADYVILCTAGSAGITVTLPAAANVTGQVYHIKKVDSGVGYVTVDANASETIDGAATQVIALQYDNLQIACDGSNWHII